ncbi:hypothetical protein MtrunA17_Chr5g0412051 [Medicago truncatula]|uniref:Uncharacterized protein n=1 Tax=Medicago truncatula TaxID=3880 RepID=A0A396HU47_MEDTR|nr:hypothetical protein MtrunA17_Chr5g0412051 [Medicago truncatula]
MEAPSPATYETSLEIMEENPPLPVQPNPPVAAYISNRIPFNENPPHTIQPQNPSLPSFIPPPRPSSMSVTAPPQRLGSRPLTGNVIEAYCGEYAKFICMEIFKALIGFCLGSLLVSVPFCSF